MKKIGAITVGQAPRTVLIPEMEPILGDSVEIIQMGGLDGLTKEEIDAFRPLPGDQILVSRLTDGSSVTFGESYVLPRLQDCIHKLEKQGVSLVLFLCTGEFPADFHSEVPLIFPDHILKGLVPAVCGGRLTVFVPSESQRSQMPGKWGRCCSRLDVIAVSPYDGADAVLAAARQVSDDTDMILLDCIGYTVEMKSRIQSLTGKPVLLPRTLVARVICELV